MHYLGIDWADRNHALCLLAPDGRILSQFLVNHDWSGFQELHQLLERFDDTHINIERRNGLLTG